MDTPLHWSHFLIPFEFYMPTAWWKLIRDGTTLPKNPRVENTMKANKEMVLQLTPASMLLVFKIRQAFHFALSQGTSLRTASVSLLTMKNIPGLFFTSTWLGIACQELVSHRRSMQRSSVRSQKPNNTTFELAAVTCIYGFRLWFPLYGN